jgi:hypothetical protein
MSAKNADLVARAVMRAASRLIGTLACLSLFAAGLISAQQTPEPDFRKASWGMTQAQVMATEQDRPVEVRHENGEVIVKYDPVKTEYLTGRLIYIFANDKLVRAKYVSDAVHSEWNDFIADFRAVEPLLMERYGKPSTERAVWLDDLYQQERLPYLDQDRALASDILTSDQNAGLSISLGNLRLITQRSNAQTKIIHALTGANSHIVHQVEYRSVEFEAFENRLLHPKP